MDDSSELETRLVHAGEPRVDGAVSMPVFQSSTFLMSDGAAYDDIRYARLNNTPNHVALHDKLASLDGAEAALVTSSGMAAMTTTLMTVLDPGDHLLVQRGIYGGSFSFIRDEFARQSIDWDFVDSARPETWEGALRETTRGIYVETLANPTLTVADLPAVADFARELGIVSMVDNTFASPVNARPIELGFDLSIQSASKYLNGHSDLVAGTISGSAERIEAIRHQLNHWGGTLDPHACFLLHRGVKTLALRVARQNETAAALAEFLAEHPAVGRVNYPSLASHRHRDLATSYLDGFGGVLSFELSDTRTARAMITALDLALYAPSLGGPETLVVLPATSSHAGLTAEERAELGIADGLVRVSVGIEATSDVIADFEQAIDTVT